MGKLSGKVAIVTGATSGMGRAIAEKLAREGAAVVVGGRNSQRGREVVDTIRTHSGQAKFVEGDVGLYETNEDKGKQGCPSAARSRLEQKWSFRLFGSR